MFLQEENNRMFSIYKNLLLESPDTILVDGEQYAYYEDIGNYTGFMNTDGKFAMTNTVKGHANFRQHLKDDRLEEMNVIHNFDSDEEMLRVISGHRAGEKFRLWPRFKIFSVWYTEFDPDYKAAIDNILAAIPGGKSYKFDPYNYDDNDVYLSYKEFVNSEMTDEKREKLAEIEREKRETERKMADYVLGNKPRSIDYDDVLPRKQNFYRRDGD